MSSKSRSIKRKKLRDEGKLPPGNRRRENPLTADRYYPSLGRLPPTNPISSQGGKG